MIQRRDNLLRLYVFSAVITPLHLSHTRICTVGRPAGNAYNIAVAGETDLLGPGFCRRAGSAGLGIGFHSLVFTGGRLCYHSAVLRAPRMVRHWERVLLFENLPTDRTFYALCAPHRGTGGRNGWNFNFSVTRGGDCLPLRKLPMAVLTAIDNFFAAILCAPGRAHYNLLHYFAPGMSIGGRHTVRRNGNLTADRTFFTPGGAEGAAGRWNVGNRLFFVSIGGDGGPFFQYFIAMPAYFPILPAVLGTGGRRGGKHFKQMVFIPLGIDGSVLCKFGIPINTFSAAIRRPVPPSQRIAAIYLGNRPKETYLEPAIYCCLHCIVIAGNLSTIGIKCNCIRSIRLILGIFYSGSGRHSFPFLINTVPVLLRAAILNLQTSDHIKSIFTNTVYTSGKVNLSQLGAALKCLSANGGYILRNCNAGQAAAAGKRPIVNTSHAVWNRNRDQASATVKCSAFNNRYAVRNFHLR